MLIREIYPEEKRFYNQVVHHPQQSWEWGEFKKLTGTKVERIGFFENGELKKALQVTFHHLPLIGHTAGYFPRGDMPDADQLSALRKLGQKNQALFVKMEPNVSQPVSSASAHQTIADFLLKNGAVPGRPLFTQNTFILDLGKSEEELFNQLNSKTRYNVRLAIKKGVQIYENTTHDGMETYIKILEETTKRQQFYAHTPDYFRKMWQTLGESGIIRIFQAVYQDQVLASWVMFIFNGTLYYPYGASISAHRDVMASNLLMWEMIRFGKREGATKFDMWGALSEEPDKNSPWYGFHRFKKGYGGVLHQFIGTYDLVLNFPLYQVYRLAENLRWKFLRLKAKIGL